jgi:hypothetical protein
MRTLALLIPLVIVVIELADQVFMTAIIMGGYRLFTGRWPWE